MLVTPSNSFTRPANTTQYADADLVANSATAGSVVPLKFQVSGLSSGRGRVRRARLHHSQATNTDSHFSLHLFSADPTSTAPTNGDNGAFALAVGSGSYLGEIAIDGTTLGMVATDGAMHQAAPASPIIYDLDTGRTLYGLIEAKDTYTPASAEVFTVTIEVTD